MSISSGLLCTICECLLLDAPHTVPRITVHHKNKGCSKTVCDPCWKKWVSIHGNTCIQCLDEMYMVPGTDVKCHSDYVSMDYDDIETGCPKELRPKSQHYTCEMYSRYYNPDVHFQGINEADYPRPTHDIDTNFRIHTDMKREQMIKQVRAAQCGPIYIISACILITLIAFMVHILS